MVKLELHFPHFNKNEPTDRALEAAILSVNSDVYGGSSFYTGSYLFLFIYF